MLTTKQARVNRAKHEMLAGVVTLLRQARDLGERRRSEAPLDGNGACDLCGCIPSTGRLLTSDHAVEAVVHPDGSCEARPWLVADLADGMFWLCNPCYRLLRRDPAALLRRLIAAHTAPAN
jgi:hypothetical protein